MSLTILLPSSKRTYILFDNNILSRLCPRLSDSIAVVHQSLSEWLVQPVTVVHQSLSEWLVQPILSTSTSHVQLIDYIQDYWKLWRAGFQAPKLPCGCKTSTAEIDCWSISLSDEWWLYSVGLLLGLYQFQFSFIHLFTLFPPVLLLLWMYHHTWLIQ